MGDTCQLRCYTPVTFAGLIFVAGQKTTFSDAGLVVYMFIVAVRQGKLVVVVYGGRSVEVGIKQT